jgi:plasmid stabilization system protein ParE
LKYLVKLTPKAEQDLLSLFEFILQRELDRDGDIGLGTRAINAIRDVFKLLGRSPFSCRKAGDGAFLRELVIPFGRSGYVALFEIVDDSTVVIAAVRHQLEDDYH